MHSSFNQSSEWPGPWNEQYASWRRHSLLFIKMDFDIYSDIGGLSGAAVMVCSRLRLIAFVLGSELVLPKTLFSAADEAAGEAADETADEAADVLRINVAAVAVGLQFEIDQHSFWG